MLTLVGPCVANKTYPENLRGTINYSINSELFPFRQIDTKSGRKDRQGYFWAKFEYLKPKETEETSWFSLKNSSADNRNRHSYLTRCTEREREKETEANAV